MKSKCSKGDRVRLTKRAPKEIYRANRPRTRRVIGVFYDPQRQCSYYALGNRGRGQEFESYFFRCYMLRLVCRKEAKNIGRPRQKHSYDLGTKLLINAQNQNLGG